ncbi:RebB like protein [Bacillus pseudomycoides]|nr:RebB like protein [Bacillus pseudomycoides]
MAEAPAQAMAALYQVASHSAGLALQNSVHSQQALNQINSAVISKAVSMILSVGEKV